jgi:tRNA dimethylallyltransferase
MSKIILIVGPTATGKTALSIALAKHYNAQIINADSTQIFKEPLIATAKITEEEKEGIPHHMIDIKSFGSDYSIYDYQKDARKVLDDLISKDINVIIVGGSGLYVKALLYDYNLEEEDIKDIDLSSYSNEELKSMADLIDENNNIHVNNRHRLERYIKYNKSTGKVITKKDEINKKKYDFITIGLTAPREEIYKRCDNRVEEMFNMGLLDEAKSLYDKHYKNFTTIIGYRELNEYFNNNISLDEAKEMMKKNTRHYAKRQITFYKHQFDDIKWFTTDYSNFNNTINEVINYLKEKE